MSINQGSFDRFGADLVISSQNVVYAISQALLKLNKALINDPKNIVKYRKIYENEIRKIANVFDKEWKSWADEDLAKAYIAGAKSAESQIKAIGGGLAKTNEITNGTLLLRQFPPPPGIPEIPGQVSMLFKDAGIANHETFFGVFRQSAYYSLEGQNLQILRKSDDLYRKTAIMTAEKRFSEGDVFVRRQFSQDLLNEFARQGVQTITYKNGAKYSIDTYCETLGRTMSGRCALQANLNRMVESGYELGIVSSHFRACDFCTPYEGQTLSIDGKDKRYESIADAELQGLFHANCLHDISPFFEGLTPNLIPSVDKYEQQLINEYGYHEAQKMSYAAQQGQRHNERQIRNWKRREAVALDDVTKRRCNNKVRDWQEKQRNHLKENQYLRRKYEREQIKKAH